MCCECAGQRKFLLFRSEVSHRHFIHSSDGTHGMPLQCGVPVWSEHDVIMPFAHTAPVEHS